MKVAYSIIISCLLVSCGNPKQSRPFKAFDFSYNDVFSTCFSIKFTQGDTVFIRQHFTNADSGILKRNTTYYAIISDENRAGVDMAVKNIHFDTLKNRYEDTFLSDGVEYQFYVDQGSTKKTIYVHSEKAPPQLDSLAKRIADFKSKLTIVPIDTTIEFGSLKYFLPPKIPPPIIEFTPPKKKRLLK